MPEWKPEILRRLAPLKLAPTCEAEIAEELAQHLEDRYQELLSSRHTEDSAFRTSLDELKDETLLVRGLRRAEKNFYREPIAPGKDSPNFLSGIAQDVRFALRTLRKSPGFTTVAVLTLALGIGANTAIFSIADSVLIRSLPFPHANRLVWLVERNPEIGSGEIFASPPTFLDWRQQQHAFSGLSVVSQDLTTLTGNGEPTRLQVADVSASFFSLMGIRPELGRNFLTSDDRIGAPRVVILANQLWRDRFGADPHIVGRLINLDDKGFTVVGVAPPPAFDFPSELGWRVSLWTPVVPTFDADALSERGAHFLPVIGRLKPGQSIAAASADINAIERRIVQNRANYYQGFSASLLPLKQRIVGDVSFALWILLAAAGFVLLIACSNVANLVLARSTVRQREVAVRRALGATGMRLARQLLTESLLMALAGGATGILIAYGGLHGFLAIAPLTLPRLAEIHVSGQVLMFAIFLSAMAAAIFGVVPAWKAARFDPASALRGDHVPLRATPLVKRGRVAIRMLAIAEIAVTLVLLVGASLMLKSLLRLVSVNPGFSPRNVIAFQFSLDAYRYPHKVLQVAFFDDLLRRVRALPEIQSVGLGKDLPMFQNMSSVVSVNGKSWGSLQVQQATVGPEYFATMGIPLIKGRLFDVGDRPNSQPVAIVNEAFVRRFFPQGNLLSQHVQTHFMPIANRLIVGVVGDVLQSGPAASPPPEVYIPLSQAPNASMTLLVRTQTSPESVIPAVKGIVASLDKNQAIDKIVTMESLLSKSTAQPRFYSFLLGIFANLALLLASIGTYGVIAYSVAQRTHEIGIRMALGAQRRDVLGMVVWEGMALAGIGIAIGVGGALALTRFLRSMLFEVKPTNPATFAGVAMLLVMVALFACYIPARRAMKVDPMVALRYE